MDGLKLSKWEENFETGLKSCKLKLITVYSQKKLYDFCSLKTDEENQMLVLEIFNDDELPKEIEDRITGIYEYSKPEDWV